MQSFVVTLAGSHTTGADQAMNATPKHTGRETRRSIPFVFIAQHTYIHGDSKTDNEEQRAGDNKETKRIRACGKREKERKRRKK